MVSGCLSWYVSNIEIKVDSGSMYRMASKSCLMTSTDTLMVQTSGSSVSQSSMNRDSKTGICRFCSTLPTGRGAPRMSFFRPPSKSMPASLTLGRVSTVVS